MANAGASAKAFDVGEVCSDWVKLFTQALLPPKGEVFDNEFMRGVRDLIGCEGVSVFLLPETDLTSDPREWEYDPPARLTFYAGIGYTQAYRGKRYFLNGKALTSWVFTNGTPVNAGRTALMERKRSVDPASRLDFSDTCKLGLESLAFRNVIAAPIVCRSGCAGVLKFENKAGTSEDEAFSPADLVLAKILAALIGWAYEQRRFYQYWAKCEAAAMRYRSITPYLEEICLILRSWLRCECVSVFLKELDQGEEVLRFTAGVGYLPPYRAHKYPLVDADSPNYVASLTGYVFKHGDTVRGAEAELRSLDVPYSGACRSYIVSRTFRNVLAVALEHGNRRLGVLKLENKMPDSARFEEYDEQLCKTLIDQLLVPNLAKMLLGNAESAAMHSRGFEELTKHFGPPERLKKDALRKRVSEIKLLMKRADSAIKVDDWAAFLKVSRPHAYRLQRATPEGRDPIEPSQPRRTPRG